VAEAVGFVGLGTMGGRMAARLLAAGHPVVAHTRTPAHGRPLAALGAELVASPAAVAERCDVVLGCLLDSAVVEHVHLGPSGLLSVARRGQVFAEHGTFAPALARRLAAVAAERGATFLDAPVTGGPEGAAAGSLVCMVGGEAAAVERAAPAVGAFAREVVRVGPSGAGLELKLVNQLLVAVHAVAAAEAAALLQRLDVPWPVAERVLTSGWASSAVLARSLPRVAASDYAGSGAPIGLLLEVLPLVAAVCQERGVDAELFRYAHETLARATDAGLGELDIAGLVGAVRRHERGGGP
jgi:3-hydroxyisobutyrate dehydrogenase-like beta-hydroxyacid dehydrogenase